MFCIIKQYDPILGSATHCNHDIYIAPFKITEQVLVLISQKLSGHPLLDEEPEWRKWVFSMWSGPSGWHVGDLLLSLSLSIVWFVICNIVGHDAYAHMHVTLLCSACAYVHVGCYIGCCFNNERVLVTMATVHPFCTLVF